MGNKLIKISEERIAFNCPGCRGPQQLPVTGPNAWGFNGSYDKPTFTPSILTRRGKTDLDFICHSFVKDGMIQFLSDCTHKFAGQTLELPDVETEADLFEKIKPTKERQDG